MTGKRFWQSKRFQEPKSDRRARQVTYWGIAALAAFAAMRLFYSTPKFECDPADAYAVALLTLLFALMQVPPPGVWRLGVGIPISAIILALWVASGMFDESDPVLYSVALLTFLACAVGDYLKITTTD